MPEKKIFLEGIGEVILRKRRGTRRLSIRINRNGKVSMSVPFLLSFNQALRFLTEKEAWVKTHLRKIALQTPIERIFVEGDEVKTSARTIRICRTSSFNLRAKKSGNLTEVFVPLNLDISSKPCQEFIRKTIRDAYRRDALEILPPRLAELARMHGFVYSGIGIRYANTRWGSCSHKNRISLSVNLLHVPEDLRDYVMLHELVHTIHKNHGPDFWKALEKHVPHAREKSVRLKQYARKMDNFSR